MLTQDLSNKEEINLIRDPKDIIEIRIEVGLIIATVEDLEPTTVNYAKILIQN